MSTDINPPVPLFILHWNRPEECIQTVTAFQSQGLAVDVKVLDNCSNPEEFRKLSEHLPAEVQIIRLNENKGWGAAFNVVLKEWLASNGSEVCFISAHDALPAEHCLDLLLRSLKQDPTIGIACPEYGKAEILQFSLLRYVRFVPVPPRSAGEVESVDMPYGTLIGFRRQCLRDIGLFDERYFAYGDEHEIGLRARRLNWKVSVVWGAVVVNPGTWTASATRSYLFTRNSLLLVRTYGGKGAAALRLSLMIPNTLRMWLVGPKEGYSFSARARMMGMRDFLLGRFGPPPNFVTSGRASHDR